MDTIFVALLSIAVALGIYFTFACKRDGFWHYFIFKTLAGAGLLTVAFYLTIRYSVTPALLTAMFFSVAGDVLLAFRYRFNKVLFTALGMFAFCIAQICFATMLSVMYGVWYWSILWAALASVAFLSVSIFVIKNKYKSLMPVVAFYMLCILLSLVVALYGAFGGSKSAIFALLAATSFLFSDSLLGTMYFGGKDHSKKLENIVHILYYSAQVLYLLSIHIFTI